MAMFASMASSVLPKLASPLMTTVGLMGGVYMVFNHLGGASRQESSARAMRELPGCTATIAADHDMLLVPLEEMYDMVSVSPDPAISRAAFVDLCRAIDDMVHDMNVLHTKTAAHSFHEDPSLGREHLYNVVGHLKYFLRSCDVHTMATEETGTTKLPAPLLDIGLPVMKKWRHALMNLYEHLASVAKYMQDFHTMRLYRGTREVMQRVPIQRNGQY